MHNQCVFVVKVSTRLGSRDAIQDREPDRYSPLERSDGGKSYRREGLR